MIPKKLLLVTGSPRSGTTWVGRMIAQSPSVQYIHEPFNISSQFCACGVKLNYWFYYISKINEKTFFEHIEHSIKSPFSLYNLLNLKTELRITRRFRLLSNYIMSLFTSKTIIKDPNALFSAEWLAEAFNMDVVVIIRHPAAIVSSYKKLNWGHPFSHFTKQPLLMEEHLNPFEAEIIDFATNQRHMIDQAALLWKLIYHVVLKYQNRHRNWIFMRHEDLARDPLRGFQKIFDKVNLKFSDRIKRRINEYSKNVASIKIDDPYAIKRNSKSTISEWKFRLTENEIKKVRDRVEMVSNYFYSDKDW